YLNDLEKLTISFDICDTGASYFQLMFRALDPKDASIGKISFEGLEAKKWRHVEVKIDTETGEAQAYVDGKPFANQTIKFVDLTRFGVRFMVKAEMDGSFVMLDNIKLSSSNPDYVNKEKVVEDALPTSKYDAADEQPESGDVLTLLDADFEAAAIGTAPEMNPNDGFTSSAITDLARFYAEPDPANPENVMLKSYHGKPDAADASTRSPRIDRFVPTEGLTYLTIDYDVKSSLGASSLYVNLTDQNANTVLVSFDTPWKFTDWTHIKIRCDFRKGEAAVYVAGRLLHTKALPEIDATSFRVRFQTKAATDGSWTAMDNVRITTPDKDLGGMFGANGKTVNWDRLTVKDENKTGYLDVMRKSHPRIFTTDWQAVKEKAATDENMQLWYDAIIASANSVLPSPPTKYERNARDNINDCSTAFKTNIIPVAAAYCLTGDVRYKDRVWQELEYVGSWPDWGSDAFLCTAHILLAYGLCYDWLYNDWTEAEREKIVGWVLEKGFNESVLFYEGLGTGTTSWMKGASNWNNVCNGSNLVAAIAFADELPEIADYVLDKAAIGLPYSFQEISADGAYAEPLTYWDYGVRHQVKAMAALDSALEPGKTLPARLDFKDVRGLDKTSDFPIYYNGTTGAFNYGDGSSSLQYTPIMFWLANKYNKPQYAWYVLNLIETNPKASPFNGRDAVFSLLWYDPDNMAAGEMPLDKFYKSNEPLGANGISMRSSFADTDAFVVMARGGDETAGHSNLDAGGFVLDWMGKRWVHMYGREPAGLSAGILYGWPNYHTKTEKNGHYQYYHARGEANNTIIANPQQDMADMYYQYFSELDRFESGDNTAYGIIDMTPTNKDYEKAKRGFMLTGNRDVLVIQDEITAKAESEFYWFANTKAEITLAPDGKSALLEMDEDKMLVRITQGPADAKFGIMAAEPLPTSPDPEIQPNIEEHKLFIHITNQKVLDLTVEFVPLAEGEGIPAVQPVVKLENWSANGSSSKTTSQTLTGVVALKVDNPNAYAMGKKTYVDTNNLDIKPLVQSGRTLVPVRFISENIGASVSWNDATQTVGIKKGTKSISLQLGSDQMVVDGNAVTLDVPAQEIGVRTLIPLRALVEALGKEVFWDDRGLILITDAPVNYDAEKINKIIDLLDIRVQADGQEIKFFDSEIYNYNVQIAKGAATPTISVISDKEAVITQGSPATVTIDGKTYTFNFVENAFEGVIGTGSDTVVKTLEIKVEGGNPLPPYQSYLTIQSATSSIEWTEEKYPMNGTYDGVISEETVNRWSANGLGNWICYDFGAVQTLHSFALSGYKAMSRSYKYDVEISNDGVNFTKVTTVETPLGVDHDVFALGDVQARFVRLTCTLSSNSTWAGISEVRFYDSAQMEADDQNAWTSYFYESSINMLAGNTAQLCVKGENANGGEVALDMANVKFTSTKPEVASVDANGKVTLLKAGSAAIEIAYTANGRTIKASVPVTVE
ncbi:MAG: discoidin domain-containing protein, partial [Clostridia bacterium]|nr:discoidin domain-containing protein [Clostridia bacterium]